MGDDLFILLSIMSKLDIKDDLIDMFEQSQTPLDLQRIAAIKKQHPKEDEYKKALAKEIEAVVTKQGIRIVANLIVKIMASAGAAKDEINTLLAQTCDVSIKEIKALKMVEYTQLLTAFFKKPELRDFLESIKPLLQSEKVAATSETESTS